MTNKKNVIWWDDELTGYPVKGFKYNWMPNAYEKEDIAIDVMALQTTKTAKTMKVLLIGNVIRKKNDYERIKGTKKIIKLNSKTTKTDWAKIIKKFYKTSQKKKLNIKEIKVLKNLKIKGNPTDIYEDFGYQDTFQIIRKLHKMKYLDEDKGHREPHYTTNAKGKKYLRELTK